MSLSPSKHLTIAICPGQIGIVLRAGGWRKRWPLQITLPVVPAQDVPGTAAAADWSAALDTLAHWLAAEGLERLRATVTVSNRWARFALAPWSNAVTNAAEEAALAQACLESAYGDLTGWTLALGPARYGQSRIVCALESALLERLRTVLSDRQIRCDSVQPYFLQSWRPAQSLLAAPASVLAVAESGCAVLATVRQGKWHSLRSVRSDPAPSKLAPLLQREALLQGLAEPPVYGVLAPGLKQADLPADLPLLRPPAAASMALSMALEVAHSSERQRLDFVVPAWPAGKVIGLLALAVALGAAAFVAWQYLQLQENLQTWQTDRQRLSRSEAKPRAASNAEEAERLKSELRVARRVIDKLDTPWAVLFTAVEGAFSEHATLLGVEPDTERREVRLLAEAKDMASMLEYVEQLRQAAVLRQVYLADHQVNQQDPQHPVRFTVMARWEAATPQSAAGKDVQPNELAPPGVVAGAAANSVRGGKP